MYTIKGIKYFLVFVKYKRRHLRSAATPTLVIKQ